MKVRTLMVMICALSALFIGVERGAAYGDLEIHHIDVGQGDATLIVGPGGTTILIDAGRHSGPDGGRLVCEYLEAEGIEKLDYIILTHIDVDHVGGFAYPPYHNTSVILVDREAGERQTCPGWCGDDDEDDCVDFCIPDECGDIEEPDPEEINYWPESDKYFPKIAALDNGEEWARETPVEFCELSQAYRKYVRTVEGGGVRESLYEYDRLMDWYGMPIDLGDGATATIVCSSGWVAGNPERVSGSGGSSSLAINSRSVGLYVEYKGFDYLVAGDLTGNEGPQVEQALADLLTMICNTPAFDPLDLLRLNHHGSDSSSSEYFLEAMKAENVIISCGANSYGHPDQEVIDRLCEVYEAPLQCVYLTGEGTSRDWECPAGSGDSMCHKIANPDGDYENPIIVYTDGETYEITNGVSFSDVYNVDFHNGSPSVVIENPAPSTVIGSASTLEVEIECVLWDEDMENLDVRIKYGYGSEAEIAMDWTPVLEERTTTGFDDTPGSTEGLCYKDVMDSETGYQYFYVLIEDYYAGEIDNYYFCVEVRDSQGAHGWTCVNELIKYDYHPPSVNFISLDPELAIGDVMTIETEPELIIYSNKFLTENLMIKLVYHNGNEWITAIDWTKATEEADNDQFDPHTDYCYAYKAPVDGDYLYFYFILEEYRENERIENFKFRILARDPSSLIGGATTQPLLKCGHHRPGIYIDSPGPGAVIGDRRTLEMEPEIILNMDGSNFDLSDLDIQFWHYDGSKWHLDLDWTPADETAVVWNFDDTPGCSGGYLEKAAVVPENGYLYFYFIIEDYFYLGEILNYKFQIRARDPDGLIKSMTSGNLVKRGHDGPKSICADAQQLNILDLTTFLPTFIVHDGKHGAADCDLKVLYRDSEGWCGVSPWMNATDFFETWEQCNSLVHLYKPPIDGNFQSLHCEIDDDLEGYHVCLGVRSPSGIIRWGECSESGAVRLGFMKNE